MTIMKLPVISGSVATSNKVSGKSSQVILVPLSSDVISAVAVVVTNVLFVSSPMTATVKGPRGVAPSPSTTVTGADPSYLQRATAAEALQVKVTVVPLHTSGPASLDRTTAAEAEEMMMASIFFFYRTSIQVVISLDPLLQVVSEIIPSHKLLKQHIHVRLTNFTQLMCTLDYCMLNVYKDTSKLAVQV